MKTSQGAILLVLGLLAVHLSTAIRCGEDEYRCRAGMCIPQYWVCDGDGDCFDNDDEMGCRYRTCESGGFQCSDGACIPSRWQCDGDPDCEDGSDEYQCRAIQPVSEGGQGPISPSTYDHLSAKIKVMVNKAQDCSVVFYMMLR